MQNSEICFFCAGTGSNFILLLYCKRTADKNALAGVFNREETRACVLAGYLQTVNFVMPRLQRRNRLFARAHYFGSTACKVMLRRLFLELTSLLLPV